MNFEEFLASDRKLLRVDAEEFTELEKEAGAYQIETARLNNSDREESRREGDTRRTVRFVDLPAQVYGLHRSPVCSYGNDVFLLTNPVETEDPRVLWKTYDGIRLLRRTREPIGSNDNKFITSFDTTLLEDYPSKSAGKPFDFYDAWDVDEFTFEDLVEAMGTREERGILQRRTFKVHNSDIAISTQPHRYGLRIKYFDGDPADILDKVVDDMVEAMRRSSHILFRCKDTIVYRLEETTLQSEHLLRAHYANDLIMLEQPTVPLLSLQVHNHHTHHLSLQVRLVDGHKEIAADRYLAVNHKDLMHAYAATLNADFGD